MKKYTNEPFLRSEHLMTNGNYRSVAVEVLDVLSGVPLMRKNKSFPGVALAVTGFDKVLGLGITNESLMAVVCGDADYDKWKGKTIQLEVREVNSATGGTEPAIRIMPPNGCKIRSGLARQLGKSIEPTKPEPPADDIAKRYPKALAAIKTAKDVETLERYRETVENEMLEKLTVEQRKEVLAAISARWEELQ